MRGQRLLIVDDDRLFTAAASEYLAADGIEVQVAYDLASARRLGLDHFDVVILDNHLPDGFGLELVETMVEGPDRPRILVLTANPGFTNAVDALRKGIDDYLTKPIELEHLRYLVMRGAQTRRLERFTEAARRQRDDAGDFFFGQALAGQKAFLEQTARSSSPVLLTGETGSGKTLLADLFHQKSGRQGPFLKLNCGALPSTLVEAELFGVEKGAFTGAVQRAGLFELAHGGSLFLDEIAELEPAAQAKLLGVLDDGRVRRLGSATERRIDVRVIAATHVDLERAIDEKQFRRDLYFRLSVLRLDVPPLRQRLADLPELVALLLARAGKQKAVLAPGELEKLAAYRWPGNVRELRNVLDRAVLLQPNSALLPSAFLVGEARPLPARPGLAAAGEEGGEAPLLTLAEVERRHILATLERLGFHRQKTALALDIGLATLRRKLQEYGRDFSAFGEESGVVDLAEHRSF
jgi:DNA-binding NtrC family response regulator